MSWTPAGCHTSSGRELSRNSTRTEIEPGAYFRPDITLIGSRGITGSKKINFEEKANLPVTKEKYKKLKQKLKALQSKIDAMWDAPGMPGANEIKEEFFKESASNEL